MYTSAAVAELVKREPDFKHKIKFGAFCQTLPGHVYNANVCGRWGQQGNADTIDLVCQKIPPGSRGRRAKQKVSSAE